MTQELPTVETQLAQAIASLRQAHKDGWKPTEMSLQKNPKYAPLRTRKDFQELLKEVEKLPKT